MEEGSNVFFIKFLNHLLVSIHIWHAHYSNLILCKESLLSPDSKDVIPRRVKGIKICSGKKNAIGQASKENEMAL